MVSSELSSGVIQSLILVMAGCGAKDNKSPSAVPGLKSECKKLCSHFVKTVFEGAAISKIPSTEVTSDETEVTPGDENVTSGDSEFQLLDSEACCRLLETLIVVSGLHFPKMFGKIADKIFGSNLLDFAVHPVANYPLQKLLGNCPDKEMVREL